MPDFKLITVYEVMVSGRFQVQAKDPDDAINKAKEYFEDNIKELDFNYTQNEVWVEVPE